MLPRTTSAVLCVAILLAGAFPAGAEIARTVEDQKDEVAGSDRMKWVLIPIPCLLAPDGPMPQTRATGGVATFGDPADGLWGWSESFVEWIPNALAGGTLVIRGRVTVETEELDRGRPVRTTTTAEYARVIQVPGPCHLMAMVDVFADDARHERSFFDTEILQLDLADPPCIILVFFLLDAA
jgi:hypothetical protein